MAEKFSQFTQENTLTSISGLVGYITGSPGTNIQVTPAKISEGLGFVSNVLAVSAGGTSISSYSTGMILYSDSANSLATLSISATAGDILKVSSSGIPEWGAAPTTGISGSGTTLTLPIFSGATAIGDSNISQSVAGGDPIITMDSSDIRIKEKISHTESPADTFIGFTADGKFEITTDNTEALVCGAAGEVELKQSGVTVAKTINHALNLTGNGSTFEGRLRMSCQLNNHYVDIIGPDHASNTAVSYTMQLPNKFATQTPFGSGRILEADSAGLMQWIDTPSGGGGSSPWTTSGNNIYNNNTANVGVGSTNPGARLTIEGSGSSGMSNAFQIQQNGGAAWLTASDAGTLSLTNSMSSLGKLSCAQLQVTSSPVAGRVLTSDAAGNASWQAAGGGFTANTINGNVSSATAGNVYLISTNGMTPNATVTLAAGTVSDTVGVKWAGAASQSNTLVIKTQTGKKIDGVVRDTNGLPVGSLYTYYEFICDSNGDWFIK